MSGLSTPKSAARDDGVTAKGLPPRADDQCHVGGHGYEEHRDELLARLRRIEGQVRGIQGMINDGRYCIDILTQMAAVQAALNKVGLTILAGHTKSCVTAAAREGNEEAKIQELIQVIQRFVR